MTDNGSEGRAMIDGLDQGKRYRFSITAVKVATGERLSPVSVSATTVKYPAVRLIKPTQREGTLFVGGFNLDWNVPARPNPYPVSYYEVKLRYHAWDEWQEKTYRVDGDRTDFTEFLLRWPYRTTFTIQVQAVFVTVDVNGVVHEVRSAVARTSVTTPGERVPKDWDEGDA